jgi:hypothetical protein
MQYLAVNRPEGAVDTTDVVTVGQRQDHGFQRDPGGEITTFDAQGAGAGPGQGTIPTYSDDADGITGFYLNSEGLAVGFTQKR